MYSSVLIPENYLKSFFHFQIVETEQKSSQEAIDDLRAKYKSKMAELKDRNDQLSQDNDSLLNEVQSLRYQMDDNKMVHEKTVSQLQNDMKVIKNEWEKKCQEIDLSSQRNMVR